MEGNRRCCLAEVKGQNKKWEGSASGIVINAKQGVILSHATLLMPYLMTDRRVREALLTKEHLGSKWFNKLQVTVTVDGFFNKHEDLKSQSCNLASLTNVSLQKTANAKPLSSYYGEILHAWKVPKFSQTINRLFPSSDGWKFSDEIDEAKINKASEQHVKKQTHSSAEDHAASFQLLPYFVLIKAINWNSDKFSSPRVMLCKLSPGEQITAVGTPFGSLCPEVFLNSSSQGVVCKIAGDNGDTVLSDARCIPGSEGGGMFDSNGRLAAVIVAPLCWKANEWIGLTIAASAADVVGSLKSSVYSADVLVDRSLSTVNNKKTQLSDVIVSRRAVYVQGQGSWGTGVLVNSHHGIIITCSHVVKTCRKVQVRFDEPNRVWHPAKVMYATPHASVFDIAILKIKDMTSLYDLPDDILPEQNLKQGQDVYSFGHSLFGREYGMNVSMMKGILAKVTYFNGTPVIAQSTCVILPGASGGPLLSASGKLVGIITCNAKDTSSGASYPQVNLATPAITIWPIIQEFIKSGAEDVSVLDHLYIRSKAVQRLWALEGTPGGYHNFKSNL